jgi:hypothetical protein
MTQLTNDYNRILKNIWSRAPAGIHNIWPEDAVKAVKAMFKREFPQRKWPYEIKFTSGNRYTWVRRNVGKDGRFSGGRTVFINCEKGWGDLIHDWSHWLNYIHGRENHCEAHLMLERDCAQYVLARGWVKSEPAPVPAKKKSDRVVERYKRLLSNRAATEKRLAKHRAGLERAEKRLKELEREIRAYSKKYEGRLA